MILRVKATPNASRNKIIGWEDIPPVGKVLRVKITAPPVEGKANKALTTFLAKSMKLSKSSVRLVKGASSRIKSFEIPDSVKIPENVE